MNSINIGQVRMNFKGAWKSTEEYTVLDYVYNTQGSPALTDLYVALKNVPAGTLLTNNTFWQKITVQGPSQNAISTFTHTVNVNAWTDLTGQPPFNKQVTFDIENFDPTKYKAFQLINDNIVLFAKHCFGIASISGKNVTIYSIGSPSNAVTFTFYAYKL